MIRAVRQFLLFRRQCRRDLHQWTDTVRPAWCVHCHKHPTNWERDW